MRSIGDIQNIVAQKLEQRKERIQVIKKSLVPSRSAINNGVLIMWYSLCGSVGIYLAVRAFMIAIQ